MGNAFSDCAGSSTPALKNSQTHNDLSESYGHFNRVESNHLQFIHTTICKEIKSGKSDVNVIELVWKHAHSQECSHKCKQLEAASTGLKYTDAVNIALRQKFLHTALCPSDFIEFLSNTCTGAYGNKTTLEFIWEICCFFDGSTNKVRDKILARDVIQLCIEVSELVHYMMFDDAFESKDGVVAMKEPRNDNRVKSVIQSLTNSLLECSRSCQQQDFEYGGNGPNTTSAGGEELVAKREFMEWQRRVVPDLLNNSVAQFMQNLFFPSVDNSQLSRNPNRLVPILHSSKELMPRTAAKLKEGEVVPMKSTVFGLNHANPSAEQTSTDTAGRAASTMFNSEVFVFTTISRSKFGNKWYRVYSGTDDGWTFNQLEHSIIGYQGPTLTVIQASCKHHPGESVTFGAYTASKWEKNKKDFFGSSDCFLFQLKPTLKVLKSLPKIGTRGGHYMYFHSNINVVSNNLAKKDEMSEGLGFGGTIKNPRLFVDRSLEECRVASHCTTFEEGYIAFPPSNDPMSFSSTSTSSTMHIDSLEIYAVGDNDTIQRGFQALNQYRDIADANLRNARTVDKAAFMGDLRNGVIESKAFAHRGQVDGRANGSLKGKEDDKANGL